ncbi:hypothetical protein EPUS_07192 [Endocarpon pusillum Z07020]|uniref:Fungal STAND N-terminal Goodbye domain-containing protein n=1 Tax=Endocarpon pusillum (strain Z07020 / HMAS-L-300199) TaxID=1263415 RepID=U1GAE4_ENDPU|nr:uncharacterized protein EPUS_07192 [Endocarpon pusillum Z07020]ERF68631.1 hypothetical protein EPUS_07192 [Endocarpon pusillum Z07020]
MAQSSQFLAIWSAAKKRYAEVTGMDMDGDTFPHPSSIRDLQASLDKQNDKFEDFRKRRATVFDVLEGACKPIELVSNIAAGGAAMAFPPSTLCFGAITYLINAAKGVSASYDAIIDMMGTLKDFLVRLTLYDREQLPTELQEKLAEILATLLEVFARSTKEVKRGVGGRLLSMGKHVLRGNDKKLDDLVSRLDKMTLGESQLVGVETLTESKRTGRKVDDISVTLIETKTSISQGNHKIGELNANVLNVRENVGTIMAVLNESRAEANEGRDKKHIDKAKSILDPSPNPEDIYTAIDRTRVPGTGDWIRKEASFQAWMNQDSPVLWVSGIPGSGKSYLSGNMISYLAREHPQRVQHASHTSVAYFFFKDNNPRTRSFKQALNDLAFQVTQNDPIYAKYIASNFQSASEIETLQSKWRRLFVDYFVKKEKVDSKVYLVLDGVDEALDSERQEFLELLVDLKDASPSMSRTSSINLVMVGRPQVIKDINEALEGSIPTIFVDWRKNNQDIINYVRASIKKSKALKATPKDLQEEIMRTLVQGANGMFLWVDLIMRELSKKSHVGTIRKSLHQAPKGLREMLRHVLEGFSSSLTEEDAADLNLLLMWVTCAATPLSLGQLDTILKLQLPEGEVVLLLESKLRKQYASFFTLVREDGLSTADLQAGGLALAFNEDAGQRNDEEGLDDVENDTDFDSNRDTTIVTFCHASIGDFFRDKSEMKARSGREDPEIGVNIVEARICTLKTCLNLICDPGLAKKAEDSASSIMLQYAKLHWHTHLKEAVQVLDDVVSMEKIEVGNLLLKMLRDEAVVFKWCGVPASSFFTLETLNPIRTWLEHSDVLGRLAEGDRLWVETAKTNPGEYYRPTAKVFATQWLEDAFWVPKICMLVVHNILNILHDRTDNDMPKPLEAVPISVILTAAEWPQLEKTALWHRRLAMCLREYKYYDEAMEHFQVALDIDPGMWLAYGGMGTTYAAQKKYKKAIELQKLSDSLIEGLVSGRLETKSKEQDSRSGLTASRGIANTNIASYYKATGDSNNALKFYRKAFEFQNLNYELAYNCIEILADKKQGSHDIIQLLKGMQDMVPGRDWSRLTAMIWQYFWWDEPFFITCKETAEVLDILPWMIEVYEVAASTARKNRNSVLALSLEICICELYQAAGYAEEKVVRMWERILKVTSNPGAMEKSDMQACKDYVVTKYAPYCLEMARKLGSATPEAMQWVDKLEKLCKVKQKPTADAPEVITTNTSAVYLGLWYRETGRGEEAFACFQPFIKEALMILSDDDPDNDVGGFYDLAHALVAAGDEENTVAALQSLQPQLIDENQEDGNASADVETDSSVGEENDKGGDDRGDSEGGEGEKAEHKSSTDEDIKSTHSNESSMDQDSAGDGVSRNEFPLSELMSRLAKASPDDLYEWPWCCDGPCGRSFPIYAEANLCRMCLLDICDDCLKLIKGGDPRAKKICSPNHAWLHVDAPEQEVSKGQILIGGKAIPFEEFKERLRVKWKV